MQYDDSTDVASGHDITLDGQDLGPATIDSNNDGVADSVAVAQGDDVYLITDADHDGTVDGYAEVDSSGHVIAAEGTDAGFGSASSDHTASDTTSTHTDTTDHTSGHAGDIEVTADGHTYDAGAPTADFDGNGTADTAIVQGQDGTVNAFTDSDGDGQADTITQVDAEGHVTVAVSDGHGGWEVAATGHIDADGNVVEDSGPSTDTNTETNTGTDVSNQTGTQTDTTHTETGTQTQTGTQTDTTHTETGTQTGTAPAGDLTFDANGHDYDLGAPTADMTGDGTPDTVVQHESDGTVVGYTDTDGDGQADTVTQISPDGSVVIGQSDGHGGWEQVATGHIDANGQFVQDGASSSAAAGTDTGTAAGSQSAGSDVDYSNTSTDTSNSTESTGVAQGESSTSTDTSGVATGDTSSAPASTASSIAGAMGTASNS